MSLRASAGQVSMLGRVIDGKECQNSPGADHSGS
jgi:hypothetical protein